VPRDGHQVRPVRVRRVIHLVPPPPLRRRRRALLLFGRLAS
jgi:hypothetical protein